MKQLRISTAILFFLGFFFCFAQQGLAQAGGTNPELIMYRHNSGPGGAQPIIVGNHLGNLKWNGLTAIGAIETGASIQSFTTNVSPGILYANLIFRTAGIVPPDMTVGLHDRMIITQEGRVGIGTNTPSNTSNLNFKLHTVGNTHTTGDFYGRIHFDQSFLSGQNIVNNVINNFPPSDYVDEAYFELKNRAVLTSPFAAAPGLTMPSGTNAQGGLLSLGPGGSSLDHQLFFGDEGIFTRRMAGNAPNWNGAGAGWYKLLSSENINGTAGQLARFTGTIGDPSSSLGDSRIFDNGTQIGIGTNTPAAGINVTISGSTRVTGNTNVTGNLDVDGNGNIDGNIQVDGNGRIDGNTGLGIAPTANRLEVLGNSQLTGNIHVTGTSRLVGKVAIGTDPVPTGGLLNHSLYVGGSIIAEEVVVKLRMNWPDYVFDKNHPLLPLTEVEQYVLANKCLPGIVPAQEIAENGLNLGQMQHAQMEKIEELFLHLIALEKRVNNLENRNQELELENKKLKDELVKH